jgi:hypothetical protein
MFYRDLNAKRGRSLKPSQEFCHKVFIMYIQANAPCAMSKVWWLHFIDAARNQDCHWSFECEPKKEIAPSKHSSPTETAHGRVRSSDRVLQRTTRSPVSHIPQQLKQQCFVGYQMIPTRNVLTHDNKTTYQSGYGQSTPAVASKRPSARDPVVHFFCCSAFNTAACFKSWVA